MRTRTEPLLFALLLGVLIPLELLCALLAYETLGQVTSSIYFIGIVGLNSLFIILALRYRAAAALSVVLLALLIIPYQVVLGQRLLRVQAEATQIVAFVFEQKVQSGAFPSDLSNYTFHDADMKAYIQSYQLDEVRAQFTVFYRVGTESTSHWYSSKTGWGYYPD
jgi:hypothetical protein